MRSGWAGRKIVTAVTDFPADVDFGAALEAFLFPRSLLRLFLLSFLVGLQLLQSWRFRLDCRALRMNAGRRIRGLSADRTESSVRFRGRHGRSRFLVAHV